MPKPRDIELSLLRTCPVRCIYCPQDLLKRATPSDTATRMTAADVQAIIDNTANRTASVIVHFAGFTEPMLHPQWKTLVEVARDHADVRGIVFFSTGEGMREGDARWLSKIHKLEKTSWHLSCSKDVMPNGKHNIWQHLDEIMEHLPSSEFVVIDDHLSPADRNLIRSRLPHMNVQMAPQITRSANLQRQIGLYPSSTAHRAVTCEKVSKRKMPVVLPGGFATVCCNDYGLDFPLGNLVTNTWDDLDFTAVLAVQADRNSSAICHTECHYARRA